MNFSWFKNGIKGLAIILFAWMVMLSNGVSVPMSQGFKVVKGAEFLQQEVDPNYVNDIDWDALLESDPQYVVQRTIAQILHQFPINCHDSTVEHWIIQCLIISSSMFLWATILCFILQPKGLAFRNENLLSHQKFSAILASVTLFQTARCVRDGSGAIENSGSVVGDSFYWVPWFIAVSVFLAWRSYERIRGGVSTRKKELCFHIPFFIGLFFIAFSWTQFMMSMRIGRQIFIPIANVYTNSYALIMYSIVAMCGVSFILMIRKKGKYKMQKCHLFWLLQYSCAVPLWLLPKIQIPSLLWGRMNTTSKSPLRSTPF